MHFEPARFQICADRAWNAAAHLAANCSEITASDIENLYRVEAGSFGSGSFLPDDMDDENLESLETNAAREKQRASDKSGLKTILTEIQRTAHDHFHGQDEDGDVDFPSKDADPDAKLMDGKQLIDLTEGEEEGEFSEDWRPPLTLTDALFLGCHGFSWCFHCFRCSIK